MSETTSIKMPSTWRGELKALLVLGIPMGLTQLIQFSIFTVDVIMIGRIGADDLAAAALGSVVFFLMWMIGSGPVMAVSPLVSQALGADQNNRQDARHSVRMAMWVIGLMTPFLFVIFIFTEPIMVALGQDPVIAKKAAHYIWALAISWPFALWVMTLRNFLAAINKTAVPLMMVITAVALNAFFNYIFIFGAFGAPRLELVGAGVASTLATILNFLFFVAYIHWDKEARQFEIFKNVFQPIWPRFKEVITLGWPMSMTTIFEGMLFNACVLLMGLIGILEMAAYQIALNVAALAYMMPWGLSMAGAVRVGLAAGAKDHGAIKRACFTTMGVSVAMIGAAAVVVGFYPEIIADAYLSMEAEGNDAVRLLVISFLPVAAAFMFFDAVQVAAGQLLRGLKDVVWPMWLCGISYWAIGFTVAAYLGLRTDMGAVGIWYGLLAGLIAASIVLGLRLWWLVSRKKYIGA
ncbi:MAG: MATE family efflux transporter [Maricaulaceae bacterium]